ncbi:MAG: hypothetical protein E7346_07820 [Clostridiales bacterium]|nr:hypothetical protein [Clostridiales bacterium]
MENQRKKTNKVKKLACIIAIILIFIFVFIYFTSNADKDAKNIELNYDEFLKSEIVTEQLWYNALSYAGFCEYVSASGHKYEVCNSVSVNIHTPKTFGFISNKFINEDNFICVKWQKIPNAFSSGDGVKFLMKTYNKMATEKQREWNIIEDSSIYEFLPLSEETALGKKVFRFNNFVADFSQWDYDSTEGAYINGNLIDQDAYKIKIKDGKVATFEVGESDGTSFECERYYEYFYYDITVVSEEDSML